MVKKTDKASLIDGARVHERDTGSVEVQVTLITDRVQQLNQHFESNKKDYSGQRGLMNLLARRRSLLRYLSRTAPERHKALIERVGLRK